MGYEVSYSFKRNKEDKEKFHLRQACYSGISDRLPVDEVSFYIKYGKSYKASHFYSMGIKNILKYLKDIEPITGEIKYMGLLKAPFIPEKKGLLDVRDGYTNVNTITEDFYKFTLDTSSIKSYRHFLFVASLFRITFEDEHSSILKYFQKISKFSLNEGMNLSLIERFYLAGMYSKNPDGPHSIFHYPPSWSGTYKFKKIPTKKEFFSNLKDGNIRVEHKLHGKQSDISKEYFGSKYNKSINLLNFYVKKMSKEDKNKIKKLIIETLEKLK